MSQNGRRSGMLKTQTGVTVGQLLACQANAERCGYEGDELVEIMRMLCQPPRDNEYSGNERRAV